MSVLDDLIFDALSPNEEPNEDLNRAILSRVNAKGELIMKHTKAKHFPIAAAVAIAIIAGSSVSVYAAWRFLSPQEIAEEIGDEKLSEAFAGERALPTGETQSIAGYDVTLLGVVSGDMISSMVYQDDDGTVRGDRTYVAISITHTDGTPMPGNQDEDFDPTALFVSPYISGYNPTMVNAVTMNGGFSTIVRDGVQYRILETSNIEAFADHTIYIGVSEGTFYNADAYLYDEATGEISRNPDYTGLNALFTVPLDPSKADPEKAEALLSEVESSLGRSVR